MARTPAATPSQAEGKAVGAFENVKTDHGAAVDGTTDATDGGVLSTVEQRPGR